MLLASKTKLNHLLLPMDLKKYMAVSLGILWTLVLIISLTIAIVHNINFQKSPSQIHLETNIATLQTNLEIKDRIINTLQLEVTKKEDYIQEILAWDAYP
jgi:hypothetical protein